MRFFDSHAHYWDSRFATETESGVEALLSALLSESVSGIVNVGTDLDTTALAIAQAKKYSKMYAAGGIHPGEIPDNIRAEDVEALLSPLFKEPENKLVALGEIGLDYHYTPFDKSRQKAFFEAQMAFAEKHALPVIIHDREAHGDCVDMVRAFSGVVGVFHSYSGSAEMAKDLVRRGYYISFSGTISFKNARAVREAASVLPHDRVLIETDAPYLPPVPHRGERNDSSLVRFVAERLAAIKGITVDALIAATVENGKRLFAIE